MKNFIVAAPLIAACGPTHALTDSDIDNDVQWDADRGGTDRDLDCGREACVCGFVTACDTTSPE